MKRPQLSQPTAGAANPEFFFRQDSSGDKNRKLGTDSAHSRGFLIYCRFFPIVLVKDAGILTRNGPSTLGGDSWSRPFRCANQGATMTGASINAPGCLAVPKRKVPLLSTAMSATAPNKMFFMCPLSANECTLPWPCLEPRSPPRVHRVCWRVWPCWFPRVDHRPLK